MRLKFSPFNNPYFSLLKTAWHYARDERMKYLKIYAMFFMANMVYSLYPIIWGVFINDLQKNQWTVTSSAWLYAGAYLVIHFLEWAFHGPARIMERELAFNMSRNFLQEMYHKAVHLPVKWHQDNHSGATINRIKKAYDALMEFFEEGFQYLHVFFKFGVSFAAMIYFAPVFGGMALVFGGFVFWVIMRFDKHYIQAIKDTNEREHVVASTLFDSLSNIITVITLRLENRMEKGLMKRVAQVFAPFKRKIVVNEWKWFTVDMLISFIYVFIMVGFIYQNWVPGEVLLIGGLVTLMGYVGRFTDAFHDLSWLYSHIVRYDTDVKTAQNIIEEYDRAALAKSEKLHLREGWRKLELSGLDFRHNQAEKADPEDDIRGLEGLHVDIEKGKKVALIGRSGSGKSTLLALLRGLYHPDRVEVVMDKKVKVPFDAIHNHVTLFPQEPEIFENTIEYNITLGLNFKPEEVAKVCRIAHFSEVIEQLPNGLESSIKERGVNLSGGQKQRLALARGVLAARSSDIVLLDEPTSSVDPKTEVEIYDQLFEAFDDKVVISSLHRLHLLSKFDYVYILEKGKVVDEGTFRELREHSPVFQKLWKHQEELMII
jgi:ATP-binding cassette subfamily B protein